MAMLINRPGLAGDVLEPPHRRAGALTSLALHIAALAALIVVFRAGSQADLSNSAVQLVPQSLIWIPHDDSGGGRAGGGDQSTTPVRRVKLVGRDPASIAVVAAQPSTDVTTPPPDQVADIPAKPMADATQTLIGTVDGDSAARSAGPGSTGAGDTTGNERGGLGDAPGVGFGDGATRGGPGVTMPTVIESVSPTYTADAMRARVQGAVLIECVVLRDGSVGDVKVMRSLDRRFGLDEVAIAAAKRWRFRPGRLNGQPVPVIVSIELTFSVR
jgi:TonB family protein